MGPRRAVYGAGCTGSGPHPIAHRSALGWWRDRGVDYPSGGRTDGALYTAHRVAIVSLGPLAAARLVLSRDLLLAWRNQADVATTLLFFVIVVSLFPLAVGPEPGL